MKMRALVCGGVLGLAVALSGCASDGGSGGDPGPRALPAGASCQSIRAELNKMDSQGAHSKVEAARSRKVDPATQAFADRYNSLLNQYLGARCHV
jgi:ABC-type phosphate transport system substrate-binding protein